MDTPKIYSAIAEVMRKTSAISKDRKNQQQGFQFRGIDDVMNELHSTLAECGVFIVPEVLEENRTEGKTKTGGTMFYTRQKIRFTFYAEDGSNVQSVVIGEAMDTGDKASNKALSIGFKYACLQVFCIPTEEEKDPDALSPEWNGNKTPTRSHPTQKPQPKGGADTKQQHDRISELLHARDARGNPIFSASDLTKWTEMRYERTAVEVIQMLTKIVNENQTPAEEEFKEDVPF